MGKFLDGDFVVAVNSPEYIKFYSTWRDTGYYPPPGTVGKIVDAPGFGSRAVFVQWPDGATKEDGLWTIDEQYIEHYVEDSRIGNEILKTIKNPDQVAIAEKVGYAYKLGYERASNHKPFRLDMEAEK